MSAMPVIVFTLTIEPSVSRMVQAQDALNEAVEDRIARDLDRMLRVLGIPGAPKVRIAPDEGGVDDRVLELRVDGRLCRYPRDLPYKAYAYSSGHRIGPAVEIHTLAQWMRELADRADADGLAEFLSLCCIEILGKQPSILLGPAQRESYRASLRESIGADGHEGLPDTEKLAFILTNVLELRISIGNLATVAKILVTSLAGGRTPEDAAEDLIKVLRPAVVEIRLPREYLIALTSDAMEKDIFAMMRDGLFYELGLIFPELRFVADETLKPHTFAFKINDLPTLPWMGLKNDEIMVNGAVESLQVIRDQGSPALNPANGTETCVVDRSLQLKLEQVGYYTWSPMGYLILSLSACVRENGACFMDATGAKSQLDQLDQAFPALVTAVLSNYSMEQITRVLRCLLAEEVSIRNLRLILEWLANFDYISIDSSRYIVFDERWPVNGLPDERWLNDAVNLAALVRTGLKRYLSHKYTRGQSTLIVNLLDPEIEAMVSPKLSAQPKSLTLADRERILEAVRAEYPHQPQPIQTPHLLTTIEARAAMRELIALEFPRVAVLAYQELSPEMNIQPVSRISLA